MTSPGVVLFVALSACDDRNSGFTGVLADADTVAASVSVTFEPVAIPAGEDIRFDWSGLSADWLGEAFGVGDVARGEFISPAHAAPEAFALALVRDEVSASDVDLYGWFDVTEGATSVAVSEFADRSPAIDPSEHLAVGRPWLLVFRDSGERIRLIASVEPTEGQAGDGVAEVTGGAGTLSASFDLADAPRLLLDPDAVLDWSHLATASDGAGFDAGRVQQIRAVALSEGLAGAVPWAELDVALLSGETMETGTATTAELPDLVAGSEVGEAFVVSLDCVDCEPILPGAVFVLERE